MQQKRTSFQLAQRESKKLLVRAKSDARKDGYTRKRVLKGRKNDTQARLFQVAAVKKKDPFEKEYSEKLDLMLEEENEA